MFGPNYVLAEDVKSFTLKCYDKHDIDSMISVESLGLKQALLITMHS